MKVRLIRKNTVFDFVKNNARAKASFDYWLFILDFADWNNLSDIKSTFNSVDIISNDRLVFDVGGNSYRVICKYYFGDKNVHVFIKWIGTHAEYSKLCSQNLQYTINNF